MGRTSLFLFVGIVASCGGSSRTVGSNGRNSGDDDSSGGSGGSVMTGGLGGTDARGGTGGKGGTPEPEGGSSGVAGTGGTLAGEPGTDTGGSAGRGGSATGGTGATGAMTSITSCTEEFPFAGEWEGSVFDFYFEPLEDLRLVVTPDEEFGGYQATLTWGSDDPPPPPTSADEPYPTAEYWESVQDITPASSMEPWPGFPYSVVRGAGCDEVFRVSVSLAELMNETCALQTPIYSDGEGWACTRLAGGTGYRGDMCEVDGELYPMWKCLMCGPLGTPVCVCDEGGCWSNPEPTHTFELELSTSGSVNVLSGPDPRCSDCTVRLERVE